MKNEKLRLVFRGFLISGFSFAFIILTFSFLPACAKQGLKHTGRPVAISEVPMPTEIGSFKGLAYVVAERLGVKWADNVSVVVKRPHSLRLDALERITDVTATLVANNGEGYLKLPLSGAVHQLKNGNAMLPVIGEIPIKTNLLADILVGRPNIEGGIKSVSESFHSDKGSYFVIGATDDLEMSANEKLPLVYTHYTSKSKKGVLFEAHFDDFKKVGGNNFPQHIIIRFEQPKLVIDVRYREIWPEKMQNLK